MKKILIYGLSNMHGGVESFIMNYTSNFSNDIEIHYVGEKDFVFQDEIKKRGNKIHIIPNRKKEPLKYIISLHKLFSENEFETVWLNVCSLSNLDILFEANRKKVKNIVLHSHNSQQMGGKITNVLHNLNKKRLSGKNIKYWACSESAADWMFNGIKGIDKKNIEIINNAISSSMYKYDLEKRKKIRNENKWNGKFIIGNVGRFHMQKNHLFLIDVFNEVIKIKKNAHLVLIGEGSLEKEVKSYVSKLGLDEKVDFLGQRKDIPVLMQGMDRFILPSLYEGLPFVLIESQAAGLPSLTSDKTVSKQSKISKYLDFIDLNLSASEWAKKLILFDLPREDTTGILQEKGFDIITEAIKVQKKLLTAD